MGVISDLQTVSQCEFFTQIHNLPTKEPEISSQIVKQLKSNHTDALSLRVIDRSEYIFISIPEADEYCIVLKHRTKFTLLELEYAKTMVNQAVAILKNTQNNGIESTTPPPIYQIGQLPDQISYIKSGRNKITVHTASEKVDMPISLKEVAAYFASSTLMRAHRSYMLKPDAVKSIVYQKKGIV